VTVTAKDLPGPNVVSTSADTDPRCGGGPLVAGRSRSSPLPTATLAKAIASIRVDIEEIPGLF
jgi:hypothetical protein